MYDRLRVAMRAQPPVPRLAPTAHCFYGPIAEQRMGSSKPATSSVSLLQTNSVKKHFLMLVLNMNTGAKYPVVDVIAQL